MTRIQMRNQERRRAQRARIETATRAVRGAEEIVAELLDISLSGALLRIDESVEHGMRKMENGRYTWKYDPALFRRPAPLPYNKRFWVTSRWNVFIVWCAKVICGIRYEFKGYENLPDAPAEHPRPAWGRRAWDQCPAKVQGRRAKRAEMGLRPTPASIATSMFMGRARNAAIPSKATGTIRGTRGKIRCRIV